MNKTRILTDLSIFIPTLGRGHARHIRKGKHTSYCLCTTCKMNARGKGELHFDQEANYKDWAEAVGRA